MWRCIVVAGVAQWPSQGCALCMAGAQRPAKSYMCTAICELVQNGRHRRAVRLQIRALTEQLADARRAAERSEAAAAAARDAEAQRTADARALAAARDDARVALRERDSAAREQAVRMRALEAAQGALREQAAGLQALLDESRAAVRS
jgi:hypothetical protein